jgi:outer membrane cobalamin receptor
MRRWAPLWALAGWSSVAGSQARDSTARADSTARLTLVRVVGSIIPIAAPSIGSGVPARVSVVGREAINARETRLLSDVLAREPGVSLYDDLGSLYKTTLVTRGFTASPVVGVPQGVSVFLDGVPVNEPDAGQVNFDLLPLEHVERVEFLSGTASLLGPHSLGGAVNLITRRGGNREGEIEVGSGSHDTYSAKASYNANGAGRSSYYAGGAYATEAGWRQLTRARQLNGFLNVGRLGPRAGFNLQAFAANGYARTAGSLPFSVYRMRPDSNLSAGDFEDINQLHVALSGYRPYRIGHVSAVMYFRQSDAERLNVNQADDPDVRSFSDSRTVGGSADWRTGRTLGAGALGFRLGLGGSASRAHVKIYAERIAPRLTTDVESPVAKLDAYTLADYSVGPLTFSGGLRFDHVRVPFRNRLDARRDTTSTFGRVSPRGGVSVALRGGTLYASAGQSFRAPALIELACADPNEPCPLPFALGDDPPLDPVVATTYEAGGRWTFGVAELSASAYRTAVRDDIFLFAYDDEAAPSGSTIAGYFANVHATRREGLEFGARAGAGRLQLHTSYAYTRATFQVDGIAIFSIREQAGGENEVENGDQFPLVPRHVASLGASVPLPRGLELGVDARYTGDRYLRGDEANEEPPLSGHRTVDARLGYHLRAWEVQAIVRNVFAAEYATFGTFNINQGAGDVLERFLTPGAPRAVHVVVRRRFAR